MMKVIYLLIVIFLLQSCEKKKLNENEILEIIHSHKDYENLEMKKDFFTGDEFIDSIKTFRKIIAKENFKSIYEADFNNDGKLDYLVNLTYPKPQVNEEIKVLISEDDYHSIILLSSDKNYHILNLRKGKVYDIISAKIISHKNQNLIKLLNFKRHIEDKNDVIEYDTLMIKNNQLTEYTKSRKNHHIKKIIFTQNGGYAPGKIYDLTIKNDSIILQSYTYKNFKGKYVGIKNLNLKSLSDNLNEIDFTNLKKHYSIECSDCSSVETVIIFDNGKEKKIFDYGEKGTLGLVKFYEKVENIMKKQNWQKIN